MIETIATTNSSLSVERSGAINFADSITTHSDGGLDTRGEGIPIQDGAGKPYPSEFYTPYLSSLSQTWRKSPSE
jgi:hypothetical protein